MFAATAALGAVLEFISSPKSGRTNEDDVDSLYHLALELLQKEIGAKDRDPVALFLASIVLAWVETLGRHLTHALVHVRGALKIFTEYLTNDDETGKSNAGQLYDGPELQVLSIFALTLDLQNTTYKLSLPLQLPNTEFEWLGRVSLDDEHHLVLLLHVTVSPRKPRSTSTCLNKEHLPAFWNAKACCYHFFDNAPISSGPRTLRSQYLGIMENFALRPTSLLAIRKSWIS